MEAVKSVRSVEPHISGVHRMLLIYFKFGSLSNLTNVLLKTLHLTRKASAHLQKFMDRCAGEKVHADKRRKMLHTV